MSLKDYQLSNPNCHFFAQAFADITSGLRSRSSVLPAGGEEGTEGGKEGKKGGGEARGGRRESEVREQRLFRIYGGSLRNGQRNTSRYETIKCYSVGHRGFRNRIRSSRSGSKVAVLARGWDLESQSLGFQLVLECIAQRALDSRPQVGRCMA